MIKTKVQRSRKVWELALACGHMTTRELRTNPTWNSVRPSPEWVICRECEVKRMNRPPGPPSPPTVPFHRVG